MEQIPFEKSARLRTALVAKLKRIKGLSSGQGVCPGSRRRFQVIE
jgi:hypothetical protein